MPMQVRLIVAAWSLLAVGMLAAPAIAAEPGVAMEQEQRLDRYTLLPDEREAVQGNQNYQVLTVVLLAGAAAAIGVATGAPVVGLTVAGAVVASYVSLP